MFGQGFLNYDETSKVQRALNKIAAIILTWIIVLLIVFEIEHILNGNTVAGLIAIVGLLIAVTGGLFALPGIISFLLCFLLYEHLLPHNKWFLTRLLLEGFLFFSPFLGYIIFIPFLGQ